MKHVLMILTSLAALFLLVNCAFAQSSFIISSDDAYVRGGQYASANYDTGSGGNGLRVRASGTQDNWRKVYIKFDLSGYSDFVGHATLSIWLDRAISSHYNPITNIFADTARFYKVADDNWSQSAITWNNAPVAGDYMFVQAFAHRTTAMPDTMYSWDVTQYVRAEYTGNKMVTFLLIDSDTSTHGASLAIDVTHDTDLRLYSNSTPGFEPTLEISPVVEPNVRVMSPNGGERWEAGTVHDITWANDSVSVVKIEYTTDNGSTWSTVTGGTPAAPGSYSWTVPNTASARCRVQISDSARASIKDMSDDIFAIIGLNAPIVVTGAAENITALSAKLNGSVDPRLDSATAHFDWGLSTKYGHRTPDISVLNSGSAVPISADIVGLLPSTAYHYRAVATNTDGTIYGPDETLSTLPLCTGNCITASDDAFIRFGRFADSTNNIDTLRVRASAADSNKRIVYIKFDLSGYAGEIGTANLAIWVSRAMNGHWLSSNQYGDTANFFTLDDTSWKESTITWNNAPAPGQYLFTQVFAHRTSGNDTLFQWDVTSYVKSKLSGDKKLGFVLSDTNTTHLTNLYMYPHEVAGREPVLVIQSPTGVGPEKAETPLSFSLAQNYPNPFNPLTTIRYTVARTEHVRLEVFDAIGRKVATLVDGNQAPGSYSVQFSAAKVGSGIYFYRLTAGDFLSVRPMAVLK